MLLCVLSQYSPATFLMLSYTCELYIVSIGEETASRQDNTCFSLCQINQSFSYQQAGQGHNQSSVFFPWCQVIVCGSNVKERQFPFISCFQTCTGASYERASCERASWVFPASPLVITKNVWVIIQQDDVCRIHSDRGLWVDDVWNTRRMQNWRKHKEYKF